ncbi:MAG: hypothetical protein JJ926_03915 [Roseitalea sp.]|nr:hypothetical protein [Roseitalea sp.]MBO6951003.1 hypothetical protein [Rhizobiaceae bacterium]MBO6591010.1 hypothetical protein [Roseitalea sp.]MBO6599732.1 hypothetical protein [Roseitalea sp.]MBO6611488.1 hypothetical protein [Roseitalea sp.]
MVDHAKLVEVEAELRDAFVAEGFDVWQVKGDFFACKPVYSEDGELYDDDGVSLTKLAERIIAAVAEPRS